MFICNFNRLFNHWWLSTSFGSWVTRDRDRAWKCKSCAPPVFHAARWWRSHAFKIPLSRQFIRTLCTMAKPRVYFDVTADGQALGRITMEVRFCPRCRWYPAGPFCCLDSLPAGAAILFAPIPETSWSKNALTISHAVITIVISTLSVFVVIFSWSTYELIKTLSEFCRCKLSRPQITGKPRVRIAIGNILSCFFCYMLRVCCQVLVGGTTCLLRLVKLKLKWSACAMSRHRVFPSHI